MSQTTQLTGKTGEDKAAGYLVSNGYKIIERNWKTQGGEIDIIAVKCETIVFVEVKTLPNATDRKSVV